MPRGVTSIQTADHLCYPQTELDRMIFLQEVYGIFDEPMFDMQFLRKKFNV